MVLRSCNNSNSNGGVAYANANNDSSNTNSNYGSRLSIKEIIINQVTTIGRVRQCCPEGKEPCSGYSGKQKIKNRGSVW